MSETKHTPGPWVPAEDVLAENEANARLIAAAPDQNEALIALRLAADRLRAALSVAIHGGPVRDLTETYAEHTAADVLALRAIAKAKGDA